jgi:DNA-binding CsgD family transcriptional regulator
VCGVKFLRQLYKTYNIHPIGHLPYGVNGRRKLPLRAPLHTPRKMHLTAQTLSTALLDLYQGAQSKHIAIFPNFAVETLKKWVDFDMALLGLASLDTNHKMTARYAFTYEEGPGLAEEWSSMAHNDPIIRAIFKSPETAVAMNAMESHQQYLKPEIFDYVQRRRHLNVMAICTSYSPQLGNLGLSLRRADAGWHFTPAENRTLELLMPHVKEAFRINRAAFSKLVTLTHLEPAEGFCIFDASGHIVYQDAPFGYFVHALCGDFEDFKIPTRLHEAFCKSKLPRLALGHLLLHARWVGRFCFLSIRPRNKLDVLTDREQAIAQFYGTGLTYKEIGAELSISPATVRRHIEAVYAKLSISNKADLAFLVHSHSKGVSIDALTVGLASTAA